MNLEELLEEEENKKDLTLNELISRSLLNSDLISNADSPNDFKIQNLILKTLSDLTLCSKLIKHLSILSLNELLEDINTKDLRCLLINSLLGEMEVLVKTKSSKDRIKWLTRAHENFTSYIKLIDQYEVIPEDKRSIFAGPSHSTQDPTRRRESKIAQFRMEREIKGKLEELRKRRIERLPRASTSTSTSTTLSPQSDTDPSDYDLDSIEDSEEDDYTRPLLISLISLHYLNAHSELNSIAQEMELLMLGMAMSELDTSPGGRGVGGNSSSSSSRQQGRIDDGRERIREGEGDGLSWKVEEVGLGMGDGPLLDPDGKVLRPFTILPSLASSSSSPLSTRLRLQSEIFRSSHNLPTMTIDEFLEHEEASGNILQGGGPRSRDAVDEERKQRAAEGEEDNIWGYDKEEEGLRKKRDEDDWKDRHRKGEGNMHNKG